MGVLKFRLTSPQPATRSAELRKAYVTGLDRTPSRLNTEIRRAVASPMVSDALSSQGTEPISSTPEELTALIKKETAHWQRATKVTGIKEN